MATNEAYPHQILSHVLSLALSRDSGDVARATIRLWEVAASELMPIIGTDGFLVVYARSIQLTRSTFPWLSPAPTSQRTEAPFKNLADVLDAHDPSDARAASHALLLSFIELLILLIGDPMTTRFLLRAWGDGSVALPTRNSAHE
ncbi:MAG: hypothetical protein H7315_11150 [Herminiimonas sp.]|nr:hypothetical protein [Herminiimonas sp.]